MVSSQAGKREEMKIRINTKTLEKLNPCRDRLDNWKTHYSKFDGDITEFLLLDKISHQDKLWVCKKLVPMETLVIFAIDCSFSATYAAYAAYAADTDAAAAYAATYVAYADAYAAADAAYTAAYVAAGDAYATYAAGDAYATYAAADAYDREQARQIEALIYLIKGEKHDSQNTK
jgi:hypothetical protein